MKSSKWILIACAISLIGLVFYAVFAAGIERTLQQRSRLHALEAFWDEWSLRQRSLSHALAAALQDAGSITLIEFTPDYYDPKTGEYIRKDLILQRKEATRADGERLRSATSRFLSSGDIIMALCYDPHHRVEIVRRDGSTFRFEVCFKCHQMRFNEEPTEMLPTTWDAPLRDFFTSVGLPPRKEEEYQQLAARALQTDSRVAP